MSSGDLQELVFGTDGWRDVIARGFTFDNVARAAQAYAEVVLEGGGRLVLVGHDTRFLGRDFSELTAQVLQASGLEVLLSADYLPTPALSFATRHLNADGAVMLTASHNPYRYQGFKLKGSYGGTATDELYRSVARRAAVTPAPQVRSHAGAVSEFDIRDDYYSWLDSLLDLPLLRSADGLLIHDAMGGAAAGWLEGWIRSRGLKLRFAEFRGQPDPLFYGVNPEPIGPNLAASREAAWEHGPLFVTATDGDGDRLGVVLPDGSFFNSHQIFAVLLKHLHERGDRGRVVRTFTVSRIIDRLAAQLGLEVTETAVGFRHIVAEMLKGDVLIGGEESGGIGTRGHIPERDGLLNSLLLLEATTRSGRSLAELFREVEEQTGWRHAYDRIDLMLSGQELVQRVQEELQQDPDGFAGRQVSSVERLDGVKLNLTGDAWLLFRASGTEPVLRIYCEAQSRAEVDELLQAAEAWVAGPGSA